MPDNNPSKPARHYKPSAPTPDQGKPPLQNFSVYGRKLGPVVI